MNFRKLSGFATWNRCATIAGAGQMRLRPAPNAAANYRWRTATLRKTGVTQCVSDISLQVLSALIATTPSISPALNAVMSSRNRLERLRQALFSDVRGADCLLMVENSGAVFKIMMMRSTISEGRSEMFSAIRSSHSCKLTRTAPSTGRILIA